MIIVRYLYKFGMYFALETVDAASIRLGIYLGEAETR